MAPMTSSIIVTSWPTWAAAAGHTMVVGAATRRYDFDPGARRMLDTWWPTDAPDRARTQSLRCYAPAELTAMVHAAGLRITALEPGGAVDATGAWRAPVPLDQAMTYLACLRPA